MQANKYRTHNCGEIRTSDVGKTVRLAGWVDTNRDMGGLIFIDIRDKYGITQVVFNPKTPMHSEASKLRGEWVVVIEGEVSIRPKDMENPKLATGAVEIHAKDLKVLNMALTTPIEIKDEITVNDDTRMQYRYLDLRRPIMQKMLTLRHTTAQTTRKYLSDNGFTEVETPFLIKYTPGGARNFLVPSRLNKGKFYALAESPQLFKQLLMVAGTDRYFQIVRCFRDEDLRVDRQPEFTQVDIEMSFAEQDDVFNVLEGLVSSLLKDCKGIDLKLPLERMPYDEAMKRFGNDKPDRRFGLEHVDLTEIVKKFNGGGLKLMQSAIESKGIVKGMRIPKEHDLPRGQIEKLEEYCKGMGAKGLAWARVEAKLESWPTFGWTSPFAKNIAAGMLEAFNNALGAQEGDTLFFQFGKPAVVHSVLANLRVHLGKKFKMIPEFGSDGKWDCFWVVDPPLFDYDEDAKKWVAAHHAFTQPREEDLQYLDSDPERVKCQRYDLVLNGYEIAGGSIRVHCQGMQKRIFKVLGISDEEANEKFGFLLTAFLYGAPPHGGIAMGWDRVVWLLSESETMREVCAFPKNQKGMDVMTNAPGIVSDAQLKELAIKTDVKPEDLK